MEIGQFRRLWGLFGCECVDSNRNLKIDGRKPRWKVVAWSGDSPERCCHEGANPAQMSFWVAACNEIVGYWCKVEVEAICTRHAIKFESGFTWKHEFPLGPATKEPVAGHVLKPEPVFKNPGEQSRLYEHFDTRVTVMPQDMMLGDLDDSTGESYSLAPKLDYQKARD